MSHDKESSQPRMYICLGEGQSKSPIQLDVVAVVEGIETRRRGVIGLFVLPNTYARELAGITSLGRYYPSFRSLVLPERPPRCLEPPRKHQRL